MGSVEHRGNWMDEEFWLRMILSVHELTRNTPDISERLRQPLEHLVRSGDTEGCAQSALKAMLEAVC